MPYYTMHASTTTNVISLNSNLLSNEHKIRTTCTLWLSIQTKIMFLNGGRAHVERDEEGGCQHGGNVSLILPTFD